jgi:hypothetical protein
MQVSVLMTLKLSENESFAVTLSIPTSSSNPEEPFEFRVNTVGEDPHDVFLVAGAMDGQDAAYYVAVEPPAQLLDSTGVGKQVSDLKVIAQDGTHTYDPKTNKFTKKTQSLE